MKKLVSNLLLIAVFAFSLASCNQAQKMIDAAEQINIQCDPEVLEVVAGNIDATVSVTFPPEYFLPKATLEVTPVLLYVGGEAVGKPFVYQGEKVTDNYKTVTKNGATISEKVHFDYVPGMVTGISGVPSTGTVCSIWFLMLEWRELRCGMTKVATTQRTMIVAASVQVAFSRKSAV